MGFFPPENILVIVPSKTDLLNYPKWLITCCKHLHRNFGLVLMQGTRLRYLIQCAVSPPYTVRKVLVVTLFFEVFFCLLVCLLILSFDNLNLGDKMEATIKWFCDSRKEEAFQSSYCFASFTRKPRDCVRGNVRHKG